MIALAPLVLYSAALLLLLPRVLSGNWSRRAPRTAAALWLAGEGAALVTVTLLLLALTVPLLSVGHAVLAVFDFCRATWDDLPHLLRSHLPEGPGTVVLLALGWRLAFAAVSVVRSQRRQRRSMEEDLQLLGGRDAAAGVTLVDMATPAAWCIPGRASRVCVTSGALTVLSSLEAEAVVQHERAHLRSRHHLLVTAVLVLDRAFPRVPLFRTARTEMRKLVEMMADDAAVKVAGQSALVRALVQLAEQDEPMVGLAAGGTTSSERAWRLLGNRPPLARWRRRTLALTAGLLVLLPVTLVAGPALADPGRHCQPASVAEK